VYNTGFFHLESLMIDDKDTLETNRPTTEAENSST
jgi:hypothetical protein